MGPRAKDHGGQRFLGILRFEARGRFARLATFKQSNRVSSSLVGRRNGFAPGGA